LIVIVDATVSVAAPLAEKASIPTSAMSVENCEPTTMLVPERVVIVADPGLPLAAAKMPAAPAPVGAKVGTHLFQRPVV
jgi:hypothetical protein